MSREIKKAVIPVTEKGEGLFPLTRRVPRELLPLGEVPLIQHVVDELIDLGVEEVVFVLASANKEVPAHFKELSKLPESAQDFKERYSRISFSSLFQKKRTRSGYSVSRAEKKVNGNHFAISFTDEMFYGKKSALEQLFSVFRTSEKPVVALREDGRGEFVAETEKIANRLYKIKKITKRSSAEEIPSALTLSGRCIATPLVFDHLKKAGSDVALYEALNAMISSGKVIYGYQPEGEWLDCKDLSSYIEADLFMKNKLKNK